METAEKDSRFENGVGAWNMDDFYVIAAHSEEEAKTFYLNQMDSIPPEGYPIQIADLDARFVAVVGENEKPTGEVVSYRESIRTLFHVPEILCQAES